MKNPALNSMERQSNVGPKFPGASAPACIKPGHPGFAEISVDTLKMLHNQRWCIATIADGDRQSDRRCGDFRVL